MIHAIGDSHADHTFRGIHGVVSHWLGPVTMKRVGFREDHLVPRPVREMRLAPTDALILCFGEPDCRSYIKPTLEHRPITLENLLRSWLEPYLDAAQALEVNGAKLTVMSVVPPCHEDVLVIMKTWYHGSDAERSAYTEKMNELLAAACVKRGLYYADVYTKYKDEDGMMSRILSQDVHVRQTAPCAAVLRRMGLL